MGVGAGFGVASEAEARWSGAVPPLETKTKLINKTIRNSGYMDRSFNGQYRVPKTPIFATSLDGHQKRIRFQNSPFQKTKFILSRDEVPELHRERLLVQSLSLWFLPDLDSLDLFKGQPIPRSIINPGGRRTRVSGDPLRNLDSAARIHVFGDPRRTEAVTTNSFQDPAGLRPFLNQLQHTPTAQASRFNRFSILAEGRKKWSTWI
jgi:hypothetical protein